MSYILEALQKSEQERQQQAAPTISAVHDGDFIIRRKKIHIAWWFVMVLTILLVVLLGIIIFRKPAPLATPTTPTNTANLASAAPANTSVTPTNNQNLPAEVAESRTQGAPNQTEQNTQNNSQSDSVEQTAVLKTEPSRSQSAIDRLYQSNIDQQSNVNQQSVAITESPQSSFQELTQPKVTSVDLTKPQSQASKQTTQSKTAVATIAEAPKELIPLIYDLPDAVQSEIPPINYIAHVYSSDASKGFVIINNVKLVPGRQLQDELYLEKVSQDFIIMNQNGYLFKLPAMTNWDGFSR